MYNKNLSNRGPGDKAQSSDRQLRCLVLADFAAFPIGTVERHIAAFREFSAHEIQVAHVRALDFLGFDVNSFDVIVFHYSIVIAKGFHLSERLRAKFSAARGLKVLFIQDEYRWIDATAEAISNFIAFSPWEKPLRQFTASVLIIHCFSGF